MPPSVGIALLQIIIYPVMSRSSFLSSLDLCWATLDAWLRTSSSRELPERVIGFDSNIPRDLVNLFASAVAPPANRRPSRASLLAVTVLDIWSTKLLKFLVF